MRKRGPRAGVKRSAGPKRRTSEVGGRARRAAASAAGRIAPALGKAMESASEAIAVLKRTAAAAGRAVDRGGAASKPLHRARSVVSETLRRLEPRIRPVRLLLLDVDGVLTDGGLYYSDSGEEMKRFDIQDGMGVDLLRRAGIEVGILTGRRSSLVERRARELGIRILKQGFYDKSAGLAEILREEKISAGQVGYVGDDVQDLAVMRQVSFRAAPSNATAEARSAADYVCSRTGGRGAVREVAELILVALGRKQAVLEEIASPGVKAPAGREAATHL